jgi:hypothetical protein
LRTRTWNDERAAGATSTSWFAGTVVRGAAEGGAADADADADGAVGGLQVVATGSDEPLLRALTHTTSARTRSTTTAMTNGTQRRRWKGRPRSSVGYPRVICETTRPELSSA